MTEKSITAQIVEAIKSEDRGTIYRLFDEDSSQVKSFTPFGGQTWLGYAAQIGKLEAVKALIEIGINVNAGDKRDNRRPICSASANDRYEVVEYLLGSGADFDVSASIRNALFAAIIGRSPRVVKLLLEAGIDSKVIYNSETMKNMDAVAYALMRGEKECAEIIALWNASGDGEVAKNSLKKSDQIAEENAH